MTHKLKNIDSEYIEDMLVNIENSFDIKFGNGELLHTTTFGELCDHITNKIQLDTSDDCTTQQAFYKLRNSILATLNTDNRTITTNFPLNEILPRQTRRKKTAELENNLGFQLDILRQPHWITNSLVILLLASIIGLFFRWQYGLLGLFIYFGGLWFSNKIANELDVQTVGQLAEKMTRENYLKSRRNPKTFNKNEIEKILTDWLSNDLGLDKGKLTRETKFV